MSGSKTETEPLHTDYPEKGKVNLSHASRSPRRPFFGVTSFFRVLGQYVSLLCHVYPSLCAVFMFVCIGLALFGIGEAIFNPRVRYGYVAHDHSNLKSVFDYELANIDHWCLRGDTCRCEDPLQPISRAEYNSWKVAFKANRKIVKALEDDPASDVDVAFVGESIVEEMDGRWMGLQRGGNLKVLKEIFDSHFNKKQGGQLSGVALGVAGDTSPNVLFRLMHGEMSLKLHPKVYWLSLGMNDLSRMMCSEEVVVLGILRVVEEIINHTDSYVVINSVFPMSQMRGTMYPVLSDATEAFRASQRGRPPLLRGRNRGNYDPRLVAPSAQSVPRSDFHGRRRRRLQREWSQQQQQQPRNRPGLTDDVLKQAAQKEEEARDAEYLKKQQRARHWRERQKHLAQLNEQHRVRKHGRVARLPLWTSVVTVNRQLAAYARKNPGRIFFFDSTPLFTERKDARHSELRLDRITPRGHPTEAGFRAWEKAVAQRAASLVKRWKEEHPERVHAPNDPGQDPFDMDHFLDNIHEKQVDDISDDEIFKNHDDAWLERLGDDGYDEDDDEKVGDDKTVDDDVEQDDDAPKEKAKTASNQKDDDNQGDDADDDESGGDKARQGDDDNGGDDDNAQGGDDDAAEGDDDAAKDDDDAN